VTTERLKAHRWHGVAPGEGARKQVEIAEIYGCDEPHEVIRRSLRDYRAKFGG
jgi:hypothetical protein